MISIIKSVKGKIPPLKKWRLFSKVLNKKERIVFLVAISLFFLSLIVFFVSFYLSNTEKVPTFGGSYSEGMVGHPRFLNPIYSPISDVDRDITSLLFSGLIYYDSTKGFVPNLIEKIPEGEDVLRIKLRENLRWSDGEKITARDIVFTVKVLQDSEYRSPLRPDWVGIEVEEIGELEVEFRLQQPSVAFINKLSFKIIPSHIWKDIPPQNFALSEYNLNPVGSGPYRIKELIKDPNNNISSITLEPNPYYHNKQPYIEEVVIVFFGNEEEMITAARRGEIDGFSKIAPRDYQATVAKTGFNAYQFQMPRYFALFFNLENESISKKMRKALNLAVNKEELVENILAGRGERVDSPVLPGIYKLEIGERSEFNAVKAGEILDSIGLKMNNTGFRSKIVREELNFNFQNDMNTGSQGEEVRNLQRCLLFLTEEDSEIFPDGNVTGFYGQDTREAVIRFQEKYREEVLDPSGFSRGTGMVGKSTRSKLNELCSKIPKKLVEPVLRITTIDQPLMIQTAEMIKEQWEAVGIKTEIEAYNRIALERDVIKPRNYDILLFGKAFEAIPDLFPFWHSSQASEFGLNLSMYQNENADLLIEQLRVTREERDILLQEVNELILKDTPAIFLFNPDYLYFVSPRVSGVRSGKIIIPSNRFIGIENWYIETKRIWR